MRKVRCAGLAQMVLEVPLSNVFHGPLGGPKGQALVNCKYATSKNRTVVNPTAC